MAIVDEAAMKRVHAASDQLHFNSSPIIIPTHKGFPCGAQPAHPAIMCSFEGSIHELNLSKPSITYCFY
jgi:hypothetical protein